MKTSKYNIVFSVGKEKLAFNSMTTALAEVDSNFIEIVNSLELGNPIDMNKHGELIEGMIEAGYVVKNDYDEEQVLRYRHYNAKYSGDTLHLTIAPTLACNFACPYCYEVPENGVMDNSVKNSLIELVKEKAKMVNHITIAWYGGEPLVGKDIIFELSQEFIKTAERNYCTYNAFMVSNGYLLNEDIVKELKRIKVEQIQVTIDGPPHIHNSRRKLKYSDEPTFEKIINNVKLLKQNEIKIIIRVNIDKTNYREVIPLFGILHENNLSNIELSFGQVSTYTEACKSIQGSCLSTVDYSNIAFDLWKEAQKQGIVSTQSSYYPSLKANYCGADQKNSYVIDHNGYMYKCWNHIGNLEESFSNVKDFLSVNEEYLYNYRSWLTRTPFDSDECASCKFLPVCMGGCPDYVREGYENKNCEQWKYNIKNVLTHMYQNQL